MSLSRRSRFVAALLALFSLLFTQLAVAAYACPSMQIAQVMESMTGSAAVLDHRDMPGCAGMDTEDPVLCQDHGQVANQSLDKPELPNVSPSMANMLVQTVSYTDTAHQPITFHSARIFQARSTAPPLSIRNCCFRI
jgi:hypothetical protein